MKKILLSILLLPAMAIAQGTIPFTPAVIFNGDTVRALRSQVDINGVASLRTGTDNPSVVAVNAPQGSMYLRTGASGGQIFVKQDSGNTTNWTQLGGGGSVSSVGLSLPAIFSVTGSPVTVSGTLSATLATQAANKIWAGPTNGASAAPTFRSLVAADIPNISAASITSGQGTLSTSTSGVSIGSGANSLLSSATVNVQTASGSQPGLLSAADWTTFNGKLSSSRTINTTSPLSGGGSLSSDLTLSLLDTAVTPGSYTRSSITVDSKGRLTAASSGGAINLNSDVSGILPIANGGTNASSFTSGSVLFSSGTSFGQDNANLFWDNSAKKLGINTSSPSSVVTIVGDLSDTSSVTNSGTSAGIFNSTSHTTVNGSNTTIGVNGAATGIVDASATNDKTIGGMNFVVTRGNGSDQGTMDALNGANVLMFVNSDTSGVTNKAYGFSTIEFSQSGTLTDLYDFYSERVPSGPGVVTNHYGVYVKNDSTTPVKNWLSGKTQAGGSSFSLAASAILDLQGTDGALLLPRLNSTQETALTAANGMAIYNTTTDKFRCYQGGAWTNCVGGGGGSSPLTTKGDVWGYSTLDARIPVGTNGQVLTADSTQTLGVKWANPSATASAAKAAKSNFIHTLTVGSTYTQIQFTGANMEFDTGSFAGTNQFTAPASGIYLVNTVGVVATSDPTVFAVIAWQINGGPINSFSTYNPATASSYLAYAGSDIINLTIGDTVQFWSYSLDSVNTNLTTIGTVSLTEL